ncbi:MULTISPECIES: PTS ascorbate transporter subunit IIC [Helcobacillus]|uniref:Ascorbate-specific PTS system EIIC component n=1 Tax=Helcobacillus massiliensis TaxID=521392 RepID=A0A839R2M2_9MICO|nr:MULTISPECIES: PTS ascorbate transporter subunit IIC [Helcobacillus]MBB3023226.1 PTS system ascorbate-specific IIC component [Helcobacillus massiliensis]MCG7427705.1 PTS ascorbate transporter subunit IIC [Helcobacillus sp. ACRRO]
MDILVSIAAFIVNEILAVPAFLIGLITAVGLLALRRSTGQVIGGAVKATLGFLLIGAGAGLVVASLAPLGTMIEDALGAQGVVPTNEAIVGIAQQDFGAQVSWLMIAGFLVAILLARITPLRYVFLTGHHLLFMATLLTIVLASAGMPSVLVVLIGAVLLGIIMVATPALGHVWTRKVTGNDAIAIGHFGTAGYIAAGAVGRLVDPKGRSRSTEDIRVPESLRFLRDSMVATALSMVIMYVIVALVALARVGQEKAFAAFAAGPGEAGASSVGNFIMLAVTQGLQFGIAVAVILFGVRTILGELVPAFQGIAKKVVPGAIPALDCPIVFPYAQNAVLIGFLSSFTGGLIGLLLLGTVFGPAFGLALILPGLVPHFFTGGAAGVFGNATGGRRGAIVGAFVNGLLVTFLPALLMGVLGSFGSANTTFGDTDFAVVGILLGWGASAGTVLGAVLLLVFGALLLGAAILVQRRLVDGHWDPAPARRTVTAGTPGVDGSAGAAGAAGADGATAPTGSAAAVSAVSGRYPKIQPPAGAPTPPAAL